MFKGNPTSRYANLMTEITKSKTISLNKKVNILNRATKVLIEWHIEGSLPDLHAGEARLTIEKFPNIA